ncbi:MAG: hypothetical protein P1U68_12530 [Verrucomicrobiales bacterium]|nr:hypothetical protein [Verrucomicrobiales bacterium]
MKPRFIFLFGFLACLPASSTSGADLTLEQLDSLKKQAAAIKENLDAHLTSRNSGAGERFAAAASDPKAALSLYLDCYKLVNFDRNGRPDADFRAWKDGQEDRLKEPANLESLQMQLRYLALTCQAAQSDKIETVFAPLMSFADSLSRLEELPTYALTSSVTSSVFVKAYYLENLLNNGSGWEPIPFNVGGIYEKTIFPYLRTENPAGLMAAWDKRIEQQSRLVQMIEAHNESAMRGLDRDEQRRARGNQERKGGVMRELDKDDFVARVLPRLKWDKLKDMFSYVNEMEAAQAMLPFLKEHLTHELGADFYSEFNQLIEDASIGSNRLPGAVSE